MVTIEMIMSLATMLITLLFGELSKRYGWLKKKYIPYQNLAIGFFGGLLCYVLGLTENLGASFIMCIVSSMSAGGIYDASQTKKGEK